jgi:hypothetical protein
VFTYNVAKPLEGDAKLVLTITDDGGRQVRRIELDKTAGLRRVAWNLRADPPAAAQGQAGQAGGRGAGGGQAAGQPGGFGRGNQPAFVPTGRYKAQLGKQVGDTVTPIGEAQSFLVTPLPQ